MGIGLGKTLGNDETGAIVGKHDLYRDYGSTCSKTGNLGYLFIFRYVLRSITYIECRYRCWGLGIMYFTSMCCMCACMGGAIGFLSVLSCTIM